MSEFYTAQTTIADRFQEPQTLELWQAGETETDLVDLGNIDRVPVTIFMPTSDSACPSPKAEEHFEMIQSEKYLVWQAGDHGVFIWLYDDEFMDRLEEIIKTGDTISNPSDFITSIEEKEDDQTAFNSLSWSVLTLFTAALMLSF